MKLLYILLISLFFHTISLGQVKLTKKELVKLFKSSIDQPSKKSISVGAGAWTICNQDSAYFKADTIKLYNNINYFYQISPCCNFVQWTIYKKDSFVQSYASICKEPAMASIKSEYYKLILINTENHRVLLTTVDHQQKLELFYVIGIRAIPLASDNSTIEITLERMFKHKTIVGKIY